VSAFIDASTCPDLGCAGIRVLKVFFVVVLLLSCIVHSL